MNVNIVCRKEKKKQKKNIFLHNIFERLIERMEELTSTNGKPQA